MNMKWFALGCLLIIAVVGTVLYQYQNRSTETNIVSVPSKETLPLDIIAKAKSFEDLTEALMFLQKAQENSPNNPYLVLLKAEILEKQHHLNKARLEYQRALQILPENPEFVDQLAEFYRRHGYYDQALRTWHSGLSLPDSGSLWSKFLFWNKTVEVFKEGEIASTLPNDSLKPFIAYLLSLHPHEFWNAAVFEKLPNSTQLLSTRQETYWLRTLDALLNGREDEALQIIQNNPFQTVSWNPLLESTLEKIIVYRSESFAEAFLTAGWDAAALDFSKLAKSHQHLPDWMVVKLLKAIRKQHGNEAALHFALQQNPSPSVQLLTAEMQISEGNREEGISRLIRLSREDSDEAFRAAWILTKIYLQENNYESAKRTILSQNRLSQNVMGQEILAQVAVEEGNIAQAESIYEEIRDDSHAAKIYFARQAIQGQNWDRARELLTQILNDDPNNVEANSELEKIP